MLQALAPAREKRRDNVIARSLDSIPDIFCWTKMGTEAGQSLAAILHRKELERSAGGGTFAWGIGNSLGDGAELARRMSPSGDVDVLFTPMKSAPKVIDVAPSQLLLWIFYQSRSGGLVALPEHMLVTSRGSADKRTHYALLCQSDSPLEERHDCGAFDSSDVRNLASMNPVGASQVTSVVRYDGATTPAEKPYRVAFRAKLHAEGFVKLAAPVVMNKELTALYEKVCCAGTDTAWRSGVRKLKMAALALKEDNGQQKEMLFA
jgi:hypothetical protein